MPGPGKAVDLLHRGLIQALPKMNLKNELCQDPANSRYICTDISVSYLVICPVKMKGFMKWCYARLLVHTHTCEFVRQVFGSFSFSI